MSIFVDDDHQGHLPGPHRLARASSTGSATSEYGTQVVAGTNPKKAGTDVEGIPVFATGGRAPSPPPAPPRRCIFIPAPGVKDAVLEAAEGGVEVHRGITEGVPAQDEAWFFNKLQARLPDVQLLGPNCPGIISPGKSNIGITAGHIAKAPVEGEPNVGIVSRSGTLTYQALYELKLNDIGVTTCVGIGGDPVPGTELHRLPRGLRGRPRHQGRHDDRRDRRLGRGGGRGLHRRQDDQAGRRPTSPASPPLPARRWATPAPSCPGGKGTAAAKKEALQAAGRRRWARTPPRPAPSSPKADRFKAVGVSEARVRSGVRGALRAAPAEVLLVAERIAELLHRLLRCEHVPRQVERDGSRST